MGIESLAVKELVTYRTVVEAGGINAASRRLGLSRSVVSKRVTDLETSLGVTLLHRSTAQMVPTDAGEAFYRRIAVLLQELEETANSVRDVETGLSGVLRLTVPVDAMFSFLGEAVLGFAQAHPALNLSVDLDDMAVDLAASGYDLGIRIGRILPGALRARKLCDSPRVLVGAPHYLQAQTQIETLIDVAGVDLIGYNNAAIAEVWRFVKSSGEETALRVVPRLSFNNGSAMKAAALQGLGLTVLPKFIVKNELETGRLLEVAAHAKPIPDEVYAIYNATRGTPAKVRRFIDYLLEHLSKM